MRHYCRISFAVIAVLVSLIHSACQNQAKEPKTELISQAVDAKPQITFENTVYNFGEIAAGKKYGGQFNFANTGNGVLRITEVKKCCGAVVTLDKKELPPDESGTLKVEYNSGQGAGLVAKQLHISSNDETNPEVALTIKAKVVIKIDCQPSHLILVPSKENADCPKITIRSLDKQPFSIKSVQSTGGTITANVDPSLKATKFVLEPKVDLEKLQKRATGLITISLTHPELDKVNIYFRTKKRFQMTPASIILFNPEPQKPTVKKVTVVNNYGEEFEIESASSEKGLVKLLRQEKIGKGYSLYVEITPPPRDESDRFTDLLYLHLDNGEDLPLKCYGRYSELKE